MNSLKVILDRTFSGNKLNKKRFWAKKLKSQMDSDKYPVRHKY
jgi:hypothetical protein